MQEALLILFPPTPASDWTCPSAETVISRLAELRYIGFKLKDNIVIDALHMFEHRLNGIGDILWDSFTDKIRASQKIKSPLAMFIYLLDEVYKQLSNRNDTRLLHFLSTDSRVVNYILELIGQPDDDRIHVQPKIKPPWNLSI